MREVKTEVFGREDCPVCTSSIASKTVEAVKKGKGKVHLRTGHDGLERE